MTKSQARPIVTVLLAFLPPLATSGAAFSATPLPHPAPVAAKKITAITPAPQSEPLTPRGGLSPEWTVDAPTAQAVAVKRAQHERTDPSARRNADEVRSFAPLLDASANGTTPPLIIELRRTQVADAGHWSSSRPDTGAPIVSLLLKTCLVAIAWLLFVAARGVFARRAADAMAAKARAWNAAPLRRGAGKRTADIHEPRADGLIVWDVSEEMKAEEQSRRAARSKGLPEDIDLWNL